jgi:hypothetical protein
MAFSKIDANAVPIKPTQKIYVAAETRKMKFSRKKHQLWTM